MSSARHFQVKTYFLTDQPDFDFRALSHRYLCQQKIYEHGVTTVLEDDKKSLQAFFGEVAYIDGKAEEITHLELLRKRDALFAALDANLAFLCEKSTHKTALGKIRAELKQKKLATITEKFIPFIQAEKFHHADFSSLKEYYITLQRFQARYLDDYEIYVMLRRVLRTIPEKHATIEESATAILKALRDEMDDDIKIFKILAKDAPRGSEVREQLSNLERQDAALNKESMRQVIIDFLGGKESIQEFKQADPEKESWRAEQEKVQARWLEAIQAEVMRVSMQFPLDPQANFLCKAVDECKDYHAALIAIAKYICTNPAGPKLFNNMGYLLEKFRFAMIQSFMPGLDVLIRSGRQKEVQARLQRPMDDVARMLKIPEDNTGNHHARPAASLKIK
jgi:hypothetical protein